MKESNNSAIYTTIWKDDIHNIRPEGPLILETKTGVALIPLAPRSRL